MIRLTNFLTKNNVWINPDHIVDIGTETVNGLDATYVSTVVDVDPDGMPLYVTESPSEIVRKVLEYRLAMERYKAAYGIDIITPNETPESYKDEGYLRRLAGLEEPNHD